MSRRILVVTPFAPARDARHGGARAVHGLLSALSERHELVVLHMERSGRSDPELLHRGVVVHALAPRELGRWSRRALAVQAFARQRSLWACELGVAEIRARVEELAREFRPDVVQVEYGVIGEVLAAAPPGAARVLTIYDPVTSLREFLPLRREGSPLAHRLDARCALREEGRALSLADVAVVFTDRDRAQLAEQHPQHSPAKLVTVPMGWEVPPDASAPAGVPPPRVLFVGNFIHPPNVAAAMSLVTAIFPRVRAACPGAILEIVGGSAPSQLRALGSDTVHVTGAVDTVAPYLDRAAVVAAPLTVGGGVRIKVLEALAAGKAVVASSRAVEGITARPGREIVVADGETTTAEAIVELLRHENARAELGRRARTWATRELAWSTMADRYEALYDRLTVVG